MKCLKNSKTGNIIRVDDVQANQMAGITWKYVAKSEWKSATRTPTTEEIDYKYEALEQERKEALSNKAARHSKLKLKQRPADSTDKILK